MSYPSYLELHKRGELEKRRDKLLSMMEECVTCPRACRVNRLKGEIGECGVGRYALLSSYGPHYGEEPPLVGSMGSGTVFFAGCNLRCVYCQNYEISQLRLGREVDAETLAQVFLVIQEMRCHNLNLVTPTHVVPQIVEALVIAVERGFKLPIVYNTSAYDSVAVLKLLDGIVDIYMPDFKYGSSENALKYSGIKNYVEVAKKVFKEMHRQVGDLVIENGIAKRGMLIRHLVLPNGIAGSKEVLRFIREEISPDSFINIMDQYWPAYKAHEFPELSRRITSKEYNEVVEEAKRLGFKRGIPFSYF